MIDDGLLAEASLHCREAYGSPDLDPCAGELLRASYRTDDAILFSRGGRVWCVFRGTEWTIREWLKNLELIKKNVPNIGRVHAGFFYNVQGLLLELVQSPYFRDKEIIFAGHSRGGALAMLAAALHHHLYKSSPRVITFGSPRVGGWSWRKKYTKKNIPTLRATQTRDPVPRVPVLNFWHVGEKKTVGHGGHSIYSYIKAIRRHV